MKMHMKKWFEKYSEREIRQSMVFSTAAFAVLVVVTLVTAPVPSWSWMRWAAMAGWFLLCLGYLLECAAELRRRKHTT